MRSFPISSLIALSVSLAVPANADPIAVRNVTIIDVEEGTAEPDLTVLIDGERIIAIGPSSELKAPEEAALIDGSGKFLIPGLWDMHVHTSTDTITRNVIYPLFVAHGVTGVRNMQADCFEPCSPIQSRMEQIVLHRKEIEQGTLVGPRIVASSAFANGARDAGLGTGTPEEARQFVRAASERGVDFIKVYDLLPRDAYLAVIGEAKLLDLPVAGHVPVAMRMSEASEAGQTTIEHLGAGNALDQCSAREEEIRERLLAEFRQPEPYVLPLVLENVSSFDVEKCRELSAVLVRNRTWVVPTLTATEPVRSGEPDWQDNPYQRFLPTIERRFWEEDIPAYEALLGSDADRTAYTEFVYSLTGTLHESGVQMLAGSDAGASRVYWGISLHQELERLVLAGLTPAEALRAATISPALSLGKR